MRWWKWCDSYRRITCPSGHHLPAVFDIPESAFLRCNHWLNTEKIECGKWLLLVVVRGGGVVACEVTLAEKEKMRGMATPAEMINFLDPFKKSDEAA